MNHNQCYSPVFGEGPAVPWSIPFAAAYAPPTPMDAYSTDSLPTLDSIQRPLHPKAVNISPSMVYQDIIVDHVPDAFFCDTSILDTINEIRVEEMRKRFAGAIGQRTKKLLRPPNPYTFFNWDQRSAFRTASAKWKNLPESERKFYTKTWRSFHKAFPDHFGTSPLKRKKSGAPRKSSGKPRRKTNKIQEEVHLVASGTGGGGDFPNIQAQLLGIIESTD